MDQRPEKVEAIYVASNSDINARKHSGSPNSTLNPLEELTTLPNLVASKERVNYFLSKSPSNALCSILHGVRMPLHTTCTHTLLAGACLKTTTVFSVLDNLLWHIQSIVYNIAYQ